MGAFNYIVGAFCGAVAVGIAMADLTIPGWFKTYDIILVAVMVFFCLINLVGNERR